MSYESARQQHTQYLFYIIAYISIAMNTTIVYFLGGILSRYRPGGTDKSMKNI